MAAICSSVSFAFVKKASPVVVKPERKAWMFQTRKLSVKKSPTVLIRSSIKNEVYEDQSEGVICYTNEDGEMICEGFDEGPRYHQHVPKTACHPTRDAEIFDLLLQRTWLQIVKEEELGLKSEWLQHTLLMVIYKSSVRVLH